MAGRFGLLRLTTFRGKKTPILRVSIPTSKMLSYHSKGIISASRFKALPGLSSHPATAVSRCFSVSNYFLDILKKQGEEGLAIAIENSTKKAQQGDSVAQYYLGLAFLYGKGLERNFSFARGLLSDAANGGNTDAQRTLGYLYSAGNEPFKKDTQKSLEWYKKAAEGGNSKASFNLGQVYHQGIDIEADYKKAFHYYSQASMRGYSGGDVGLSFMFRDGLGVEKCEKRALHLLGKAGSCGDKEAQLLLGYMYSKGNAEVDKNFQKAKEWWSLAAGQGESSAHFNIGLMEYNGELTGIPNYEEAAIRFEQAGEMDNSGAQHMMGVCYEYGQGVRKEDKFALDWYLKAAQAGHVAAQYKVGSFYLLGKGNVEPNSEVAAGWILKSAAQGFSDAFLTLGTMFESGQGVQQDYRKAFEWYLKAAETDNDPIAQYHIGRFYLDGSKGFEKSAENVEKWWTQSAQQGNLKACLGLAGLFETGTMNEPDHSKSFKWFLKAAEFGDPSAQAFIGICYSTDNRGIVTKDYAKSKEWLLKAAQQGYVAAYICMGDMYSKGEGVTQCDDVAFQWYLKAADQEDYQGMIRTFQHLVTMGSKYPPLIRNIAIVKLLIEADQKYQSPFVQSILGAMFMDMRANDGSVDQMTNGKNPHQIGVAYFEKAANQGFSEAQYDLGCLFYAGTKVPKSMLKAREWFEKSGNRGHQLAQYQLASMFERGNLEDDGNSLTSAFHWYLKSAEGGLAEAQCKVGRMYFSGLGVDTNVKEAYKWFMKAVSTSKHAMLAQQQDLDQHSRAIRKTLNCISAKQTFPLAQFNLGVWKLEVEQNFKEALDLISSAAKQGHVEAQFKLGTIFDLGRGVEKNLPRAFELFLQAAQLGHTDAKLNVAIMYQRGEGTPANMKEAVRFYIDAANEGSVEAQHNLALLYQNGNGVDKNAIAAFKWFQRAATKGCVRSKVCLANCYLKGVGVKQDHKVAFDLLLELALQGNYASQVLLAQMYIEGNGVEKNERKALEWYKKSLSNKSAK